MAVPVTAFFAGIHALFYTGLSLLVVSHRVRTKVSVGDGTDKILKVIFDAASSQDHKAPFTWEQMAERYAPLGKAIRTHGNFSEYVPFALVLLAFLELNKSVSHNPLVYTGLALLVSRIAHFIGLHLFKRPGPNPFRFIGAVGTFFLLAVLGFLLLSSSSVPALH